MPAPSVATVGTYYEPNAAGTSAVIARPGTPVANDLVVVVLYKEGTGAVTAPAGFSEVTLSAAATTGRVQRVHVFWKRSAGSEPASYTFSWAANIWRAGTSVRLTGVDTGATPVDVSTSAARSSNGTTTPAVNITTTGPDRLALWIGSTWSNTNYSGHTQSFVEIQDPGFNMGLASKALPSAGATGNVTATSTTSDYQVAVLVAFKPGALPPTVDAGADVPAHLVNTQFARTATETDNGSAITSRSWTIQAGPAGVGSSIGSAAALAWTPTTKGTYTLRYVASNASGASTPDDITVVVGGPPTVAAGADASLVLGGTFTRTGVIT